MPLSHKTPDEAATKIQATFRGYHARKGMTNAYQRSHTVPAVPSIVTPYNHDPNLAATKIQANFRGYRARKEFSISHPDHHLHHHHTHQHHFHGESDDEALSHEFDTAARIGVDSHCLKHQHGLSDISNKVEADEARRNTAATRIQAIYRGYHARSHLPHHDKLSCHSSPGSGRSPSPYASEDEAATKIQAAFRGYRVRKHCSPSHTCPTRYKEDDEKYDEAARRIQANFRGYRVRKEYNLKHL